MQFKSRNNKIFFITFLYIFLSSSFMVTNNILSSTFTILLWLCTLVWMIYKKQAIDKNIAITVALLLILMWISYIANNDSVLRAFKVSFVFLFAMVFISQYDFDDFCKAYRRVMYCLCIISLVLFSLYSVTPSLENMFVVKNSVGATFSNLVVFVFHKGLNRNCGMFWEPGAYQTFIAIAALLEINSEQNTRNILVYMITMVTTFSTTGYFACALLLMLILVKKDFSKNRKVFFLILSFVAIFLLAYFSSYLFSTSSRSVFGKIVNFINGKQYVSGNTAVTSATVRFYSVIKPIEAFLHSPIVGMCHENLSSFTHDFTHGMLTCTFINWFAMYGLIYGIIMLVGLFRFSKKLSYGKVSLIISVFILLIAISSENYADNCVIIIMCLYGLKGGNVLRNHLQTSILYKTT